MDKVPVDRMDKERLQQLKKELSKFKNDKSYVRKRSTPLGLLFDKISKFIDPSNNTIDKLYSRLPNSNSTTNNNEKITPLRKRELVISQLLKYLVGIHNLTPLQNDVDIIQIPLYDMKLVNSILNLIIIEGVYSCIPSNVGIPLDKRRLKNFSIPLSITKIQFPNGRIILQDIVDTFLIIFNGSSDLKNLILAGSGFTDELTSSIVLFLYYSEDNDTVKQTNYENFRSLESKLSTYELLSTYSLYISQQAADPLFKTFIINRLTELPTSRSNGIQSLIELILGLRVQDDIDISKIPNIVQTILTSKPKHLNNSQYFEIVGKQLYEQLVLVNRPVMCSVIVSIVEMIWSKNQRIIIDFIFKRVWIAFNPDLKDHENEKDDSKIILTTESELNNAFNVLLSLTRRSNQPDFLKILFEPIEIPVWSYLIHQKKNKKETTIIENVLISAITMCNQSSLSNNNPELLLDLVNNLMTLKFENWEFSEGENGLTIIKEKLKNPFDGESKETMNLSMFDDLDLVIEEFMNILKGLNKFDEDIIQFIFITVLKKWLKIESNESKKNSVIIQDDLENPVVTLINLRLLQRIVEAYKDELCQDPEDLLETVKSVILKSVNGSNETALTTAEDPLNVVKGEYVDSDDEDEDDVNSEDVNSLQTVLDILSSLLSDSSYLKLTAKSIKLLKEIKESLPPSSLELSHKIHALLENNRDDNTALLESLMAQKENEKIYKQSMKNLNDQMPSIKVDALQQLRNLLIKTPNESSTMITIDSIIDLHLKQLKDSEPFVYLNVIKGLEELLHINKSNRKAILTKFLDVYSNNKLNIDERLRIGEVLLRFINHQSASLIIESYSSQIASITMNLICKDKSINIDNRIRMSAISLLGSICNTVPLSIKSELPNIIDIVFGVLNLETSADEAITRRSVIMLIYDIVTCSNCDGSGLTLIGTKNGESLSSLLKYISENDNDLLVREQAVEVMNIIDELFEKTFKKAITN